MALFHAIFGRIILILMPFFDPRHRVDTCKIMLHNDKPDIEAYKKENAIRHEPTSVIALRSILKSLQIDYSKFTLIDYGYRKGRALLLVSEHAFKKYF